METQKNTKRKKKIAHVLKSSIYSGAENVVLTIIRELRDEFDFVYIATDGPIRERLEQEEIPCILLKEFTRRNLARAVKVWKPDIIHAHDFSASVMCATLPGRFRLISHLHYDPPWVRRWNIKTIVYCLIACRIKQVLVVSRQSYQKMVFAGILSGKDCMVGNPVDGSIIRQLAQDYIYMGGKENKESLTCDLLFVGRLVEQKNPQRFIRLVAALRDRGWQDIKAWMIGTGKMELECTTMIRKYGLQNHIELKGFQKNPYPYMKNTKILCITSRWEGFGLVAVEANLLGIPVLSTDNAGCCSIFGECADEICRSDEEFIERIEHLHQSPQEYIDWKNRALERSKRFDNLKEYLKKIRDVYQ